MEKVVAVHDGKFHADEVFILAKTKEAIIKLTEIALKNKEK